MDIPTLAAMQMNLEDLMPREIKQLREDKYCMRPLI